MFKYLNTASKVIISLVILLAIIGLLTCIGLLIENVKSKKQRIKNGNYPDKKYDLSIIVPSTIIGVSTVAIILSLVIPASVNVAYKKEREKNSNPFTITTKTDFENFTTGLPVDEIKTAKPAKHTVLRNYEVGFRYSYETKSYVLDEKANNYSLIGFKIGKQDYFYSPVINSDKQVYADITPNKTNYDYSLREDITLGEPSIDTYKDVMKKFTRDIFLDDYLKSNPEKFVFSVKVLYGIKSLSGYVVEPGETKATLYKEPVKTTDYRKSYVYNISVAATHGGLEKAKPNRKITYIL